MSAQPPLDRWAHWCDAPARLAPHLSLGERTVRGRRWVVARNEASGTHVRISASLWAVIERLDGQQGVAAIAACDDDPAACAALADALDTLERAGCVLSGLPQAQRRLSAVGRTRRRREARARWSNPLALRVPLLDPARWLDPLSRCLAGRTARALVVLALPLLLLALVTLVSEAPALAAQLSSFGSEGAHWWTLALVWPLLKGAHELGHALAVRRYGGEVHEAGIAVLVLMPVPYVDASDASLFDSRRERVIVGAAGMAAELVIASAALLLWSWAEAGRVADVAFAVALAGSVSSLLFNANPLLRFDGYFILQDLIDMPNLAPRASAWWRDVFRQRLFGLAPRPTIDTRGERRWLAAYGALACAYRYVVALAISAWLLRTIPLLGAALALFAIWPLVARPLLVWHRWLREAPELGPRRRSAAMIAASMVIVPVTVVIALPLPSSTRLEGVVDGTQQAAMAAPEAGELLAFHQPPGAPVVAGQPLATLRAPALEREAALLDARIAELEAERGAAMTNDALEARLLGEELARLRERRASFQARLASLVIRARANGRFVPAVVTHPAGSHVERGEVIGHLVAAAAGIRVVQAVVPEDAIERVRDGVNEISVRLAEAPRVARSGTLLREIPAGDHRLPSAALAGRGSGGTRIASLDDRLKTVEPVFHVEVGLPSDALSRTIGGRAFLSFRHAPESLAARWWRATRQLFLERLSV